MIPINGHILVKNTTLEKSGELYVPKDNQQQEGGKVVHPGDTDLKKGQKVYYKSYSKIPIAINDEDFHFVKYEEVIAKE